MIAVSGIGVVSPVGIGRDQVKQSLHQAGSGLSAPERFRSFPVRVFGEVRGFVAKNHMPAMKARRMSRFSQFSLASAIEAVRDAGLVVTDENSFDVGIVVGTGLASTDSTDQFYEGLLREGPEGTNPMVFPETVQNIAASHISMHFGIRGPNTTFSHGDISGDLALHYGCGLLLDGQADYVIVSGSDELSPSAVTGYSSLGLLSDRMLPFDRQRNGFVLAEGSATVVLERLEDARRRAAPVYCTIAATAFGGSPCPNIRYDHSRGSMVMAMRNACSQAAVAYPDFIAAAANSTYDLDRLEAAAIQEVWGEKAKSIPVTAPRSAYGFFHGDSILRLVISALCLQEGLIPAIAGLTDPSPEFGLDFVCGSPRTGQAGTVLMNTFSAGGSAASTMLRRDT